eukprot:TRINITY_DN1761_c0_g1_i13.p1 TRINITY_DN1761_c0_g1~~TRINITY_DN1761_c0_g1_i13.p1  ORF type:complete len:266 (-),score=39.00 TRINITY_DN1761_c0_g1_i13:263-1060(-)
MLSVLAACATTCAPRSKAASALRHSGPCACSLCRLGPPPTIARSKLTWAAIMEVVLFCLTKDFEPLGAADGCARNFDLSDIYSFIDAHTSACGVQRKVDSLPAEWRDPARWRKKLQDALSHNRDLFVKDTAGKSCKGVWGLCNPGRDPWHPGPKAAVSRRLHSPFTPRPTAPVSVMRTLLRERLRNTAALRKRLCVVDDPSFGGRKRRCRRAAFSGVESCVESRIAEEAALLQNAQNARTEALRGLVTDLEVAVAALQELQLCSC